MRRVLEDFAIFVLIVIAIPFMVLMALVDGFVALLNWCVYGSPWGNWRDRI